MGSSADVNAETLARLRAGDEYVANALFPVVYEELHRLAHHYLLCARPGDTLQTTALVHEAYLRLAGQAQTQPADRIHFVALAARAMRSALVDHARGRRTAKRGGGRKRVPLDDAVALFESRSTDLLALDEALTTLAQVNDRQARIVEMRFFGGLTTAEAAQVLNMSTRTVEQEWRYARAVLRQALAGNGSGDHAGNT